MKTIEKFNQEVARLAACVRTKLDMLMQDESGQGTTEYAILVGVLVVLAIGGITLLSPELETLWNDIVGEVSGLNS